MSYSIVTALSWTSPPLATFEEQAATIEARFGSPIARDLDSNGIGLFDAQCIRFACGLEVALWRFHMGPNLRRIDPTTEPSSYEIHANERDLSHISFHLGVPLESMHPWRDGNGIAVAQPGPRSIIVMRTDDNGNEVEVTRVTSHCEAEALVTEYESRGHKQTYWTVTGH